jgi:hypothetical protein
MGSRNPFPGSYNSKLLARLQDAFIATWADIQANDPARDFAKDEELRTLLSKKLLALAGEGIIDVARLRRLALQSFR